MDFFTTTENIHLYNFLSSARSPVLFMETNKVANRGRKTNTTLYLLLPPNTSNKVFFYGNDRKYSSMCFFLFGFILN